jgi:hypothetical protein
MQGSLTSPNHSEMPPNIEPPKVTASSAAPSSFTTTPRRNGVDIPGIPAATHSCPAALETTLRVQALCQCAPPLRHRRLTMPTPPVHCALGEMEVDPATAE